MFAPLVDFFTGRASAWTAKYNAAFVTLVNPDTGEPYTASGGGGGSAGSVTAAGVNGTVAQAVQGITGGVPVPVSAAALPLPTGAATETTLAAINTKIPAQSVAGLLPVDTLGTPGAARVQATSASAASIILTTACRRVSMYATQGAWYSITGTATTTSHYIATGERLDFDVPANTTISVLQETTAGSIRITELA